RDNSWLAAGDILWLILSALFVYGGGNLENISTGYFDSGIVVFLGRWANAGLDTGIYLPRRRLREFSVQKQLLAYGALIVGAQLADYLYAPTDYILIARLLSTVDVASYAP